MTGQPQKQLAFHEHAIPDGVVLRMRGGSGIDQAQRVQRKLEEIVARGPRLIVLDLSDLEFICSQGLGAIITAHLRSRHHRGQVRLVNPRPAVRELLEITCLTKLFPIYATIEEASSL